MGEEAEGGWVRQGVGCRKLMDGAIKWRQNRGNKWNLRLCVSQCNCARRDGWRTMGRRKRKWRGGNTCSLTWFLLRTAGAVGVPSIPVHHIHMMCMFEWDVLYHLYLTLFHLSICVCITIYIYIVSPYYVHITSHFSPFLGSLSTVSPLPASKENNISSCLLSLRFGPTE